MANGDSGFGKRFQIIVLLIAVAALILPLAHLFKVWTHDDGKDGEPGARRYDRITFYNVSGQPARDVRVKLFKDTTGGMYWDCPPGPAGQGGYVLGDVAAGDSVTWVLNHEEEDAVVRVVCEMEYDKSTPEGSKKFIATCEITAYTNYAFNSATFWFGHPHDAGGTSNPERKICGEAVMSYAQSTSPTPYVLPHTQVGEFPKP